MVVRPSLLIILYVDIIAKLRGLLGDLLISRLAAGLTVLSRGSLTGRSGEHPSFLPNGFLYGLLSLLPLSPDTERAVVTSARSRYALVLGELALDLLRRVVESDHFCVLRERVYISYSGQLRRTGAREVPTEV